MDHDVAAGAKENTTEVTLWMAMELSLARWKLGFSDGAGRPARAVTIEARDYDAVVAQIERAKRALGAFFAKPIVSAASNDRFAKRRRSVTLASRKGPTKPLSECARSWACAGSAGRHRSGWGSSFLDGGPLPMDGRRRLAWPRRTMRAGRWTAHDHLHERRSQSLRDQRV
jgi:hypothetical protein